MYKLTNWGGADRQTKMEKTADKRPRERGREREREKERKRPYAWFYGREREFSRHNGETNKAIAISRVLSLEKM